MSSKPISIPPNASRGRSASQSSDEGPPRTPSPPKVVASNSPILSYFYATSPTKTGFSFNKDDDDDSPIVAHARRLSSSNWAATAPRFNSFKQPADSNSTGERGAGIMRRFSLSSAFVRPSPPSPPNSTPTTTVPPIVIPRTASPPPGAPQPPSPPRRQKRSSVLGVPGADSRQRRAPSPMGERILKGHFDGFN